MSARKRSSTSKASPAKRPKTASSEDDAKPQIEGFSLEDAVTATKDILTLFHPDSASNGRAPLQPLNLYGQRAAFLSRVETSRKRRTSLSSARTDAFEVDWGMFKSWPEGLLEEEEAMREYLSRLELVLIEQETKLGFLRDCDDVEEDGHRMVLWVPEAVTKGEEQVREVLAQLDARRSEHDALRKAIDEVTDALEEPHAQLETHTAEASSLVSSIADMELELARLRAKGGGAGAEEEGGLPRRGTLTISEADVYTEQQQTDMATLDAQLADLRSSVKAMRSSFAQSHRACVRLEAERNFWEEKARAAQKEEADEQQHGKTKGGRTRGRDLALEKECNVHTATLALLHSLLGIISVTTPSPHQVLARYASTSHADSEPFDLLLTFDEPGGKLLQYEILGTADERKPHERAPASHTPAHARMQAAVRANDAPLLVMEALAAMVAR